jgi:CRISPR system Cascade subunit CasD
MQSWGYRSRFKIRDGGLEPSKSGVVGLLCCALGRDRSESPADLAELAMHVRVDRQGRLMTDFHTAGGGTFRGRKDYFAPTSSGSKGKNPVITEKQYLADASFVVALEGDSELISTLAKSLEDPRWPLSLGRRSCPPASQVLIGVSSDPSTEALVLVPPCVCPSPNPRFVWEVGYAATGAEARNDVPLSWTDRLDRTYAVRFTRSEIGDWPK